MSWFRSGTPAAPRCTMRCRCLDLEVLPQHNHVRLVASVLLSKWCPSTKMYDLMPVSWSRNGAPALRCTTCCLPVSWSRTGGPARRCAICCRCRGLGALPLFRCMICFGCLCLEVVSPQKMYGLLPACWSRSGAPTRRCTICCRCLALDVVSQHELEGVPQH